MNPDRFLDKVRHTALRYGMELSRPLALVSGGPDSVAMLRALVGLGSRPVVLHVDHGLRGEESREDALFVEELCERLELDFEIRVLKLDGTSSLQERARRERYRLAEELAANLGLDIIATGHTADDVAETVLMNLARGAGLRGVSGIPPVSGNIVRPLIECRRAEILAYLGDLGQLYRTDPTNLTPKYARNRVRFEVLPVLEGLYPGAGANIARAAALFREDLTALETLAARDVRWRGEEAVISLEELAAMPRPLRRYAIRLAYSRLLPENPPLVSERVEDILTLASGNEGTKTLDLPGGVVAARRVTGELALYIYREQGEKEARVEPGEFRFAGWSVKSREVSRFDAADAARPEVAYLDAAAGPYTVRLVREGDAIRPLGLGGTKKALRAMMDRKVPNDLRHRMPVVVDKLERVAWIFLGETGEEFKVGERTEKILRLEVRKICEDE